MTPRRIAVIAAAILGAWTSAVGHPVWQDAVEPAQVLAGLVVYPSDAPVGQYSVSTWTLLHQAPAAALWLGVSDITVTLAISALLGALAAGGLALVIALGRPSPLLIACAPVLILHSGFTKFQPGYPVGLFGLPYTYGAAAQFLGVVTLALSAHGATRASLLLLGLFPAVHLAVGGLLWIVAGLTWVALPRVRHDVPWRWFGGGVTLAAASAALHYLVWIPGLPALPPLLPDAGTSPDELAALMAGARAYWDTHRLSITWTNPSVLIALLTPFVIVAAWRVMPPLPPVSWRWPTALVAALLVGVIGAALAALWPESLVATVMPTRMWNLSLFTALATALGLGLSPLASPWIRAWAATLVSLLALLHTPTLPGLPDMHGAIEALVGAAQLSYWIPPLGVAGALLGLAAAVGMSRSAIGARLGLRLVTLALPTSQIVLSAYTAAVVITTTIDARSAIATLAPSPALASIRDRPGLLLTAGDLHLIQGVTRRPVVLDGGALDFLPYVPKAAPVTDRVLRELYDSSLTIEIPDFSPDGTLPPDVARHAWETRLLHEWRVLADRWRFTDIVTPNDWQLQLPLVARDGELAVWTVR
jgi:hypothetical protein